MAAFDIKGALAGKWKATEVDKGAMEAFLKVKAVPMLIAKAQTGPRCHGPRLLLEKYSTQPDPPLAPADSI